LPLRIARLRVEMAGVSEPTRTEKNSLTPRQRMIIPHILSEPTLEAARRKGQVGKALFYRWMKEPAFQAELETQRQLLISEALARLKSSIGEAIDVLLNLMRVAQAEGVRLSAAREILSFYLKNKEMQELSSRLSEVEKIVWERRVFR
jgi:hypothetical protein